MAGSGIGGEGWQDRSRKAWRESGAAGRALWIPRVTNATNWDESLSSGHPAWRHSARTCDRYEATVVPREIVG